MNKLMKNATIGFGSIVTLASMNVMASDIDAITGLVKGSETAVNANKPQDWADLMYHKDVLVVGEGSPAAYRGLEALMPTINGITESVKSCSINVTESKTAAAMAWTFATWKCEPTEGEPFSVRALYVWEKEVSDWKVTAEMYTMGEM